FAWCSVILFVLLGAVSYGRLGVTLYPDVVAPMIVVQTVYSGASPEETEELLSKPLEDALADLEGLKSITSYSQDGVSIVGLEFTEGLDIDLKTIDVENKIRAARSSLPAGIEEPVLSKFSLAGEPFMVISFSSDMPETETKHIVSDRIKAIISRVDGVGQVQTVGGLDREIQVLLDPSALAEYGISYQDVCAGIAGNSATEPAGYVTENDDMISLRMIGAFEGLDELADTAIRTASGHPVQLSMIGEVADAAADRRSLARANGHPVVQLLVSARANADIVRAGAEIKERVDRFTSEIPEIRATYTQDDSDFVRTSVKSVIQATCIGIALTAAVIYMFIGTFGATFIIAVTMPIAFVSTFFPISLHGYSLNLMTTLGLGLSMGVLVDNAILVLENIHRFRDMGYEPFEAAELGTSEISVSVLAGVLTNLGVFTPVALISSMEGQFLAPFAVTILYATVFSLWVTLSLIPSMAARMIGKKGTVTPAGMVLAGWWMWLFEGFQDLFLGLLSKTLKYPVLTLVFFAALTCGAFALGAGLPMEQLPSADDGIVRISLKFSNNVSLASTTDRTIQVENFIYSLPESRFFEYVTSSVGDTEMDQSLFKSGITVQIKDFSDSPDRPETKTVADKIRDYLKEQSGMEFSVIVGSDTFGPEPIEVQVKGEDFSILGDIAEKIREEGAKIPGVEGLSLSTEAGRSELRIKPVRWRLAQLGADISDVAQTIRGYLNGNTSGTFRDGGSEFDIKVRIDPDKTKDIYAVGQLPLMTKFGTIALDEVADIEWDSSPTEIRRIDRERTFEVLGTVRDIPLGEVLKNFGAMLDNMELPPGYSARLAGEADDMEKTSAVMYSTILLAIAVTFLIIASILESFSYALIILFSVPMSAVGVVPLMMATGANLSIFAMIGMIMLVGIVVNNAIVVVDYAEILRRDSGLPPERAIEEACKVRFKSIAMGVSTSIISFMPLAVATGRGSEFRWPIAVVAIGGLISGGLLSLLAIPAAYRIYWSARINIGASLRQLTQKN
ncbi:MAG: efflux RND transporter permease subunit, partial [Synergistaceae bacterium]|nr:efflux RND transporter permease subunit [Synergistaceae bacterium]